MREEEPPCSQCTEDELNWAFPSTSSGENLVRPPSAYLRVVDEVITEQVRLTLYEKTGEDAA